MGENIFLHTSILLAMTVSIAFLVRLLRQPLIIAYLVAGIIAGPLFLNITHGNESLFNAFAQFGIVLLLFVVGLSLNFEYIKRVGRVVLIGGIIQFLITALFGFIIMTGLGFSLVSSVFVAIAITFSSTIIVMKILGDKRDLETVYGRYVIGLLLLQDVMAIILLLFLNTNNTTLPWQSIVLLILGKTLLLGVFVYVISRFLLPKIMDRVASSTELLFIFTIAWCFGIASLVYAFGFSVEIGAVIAGISLGASPYQREIASRIRPLRDFFLVLFFIVLGSQLQLVNIRGALVAGVIIALFVLIVEPVILYLIMRKLKYTRRNAFLAGITVAQISEFGFILAFKGRELGYLPGVELEVLTIVALVTIMISSYLIEHNETLYRKLIPIFRSFGPDRHQEKDMQGASYDVFVFGYHRIGWKVCEALQIKKVSFAVVDYNPDAILKLKHRHIPASYGDAADIEFLDSLPLAKATLVISTLPQPEDQLTLIEYIRHHNPTCLIIGNLYHKQFLNDFYAAGANYVIMPHLVGGNWIESILASKPWTKQTFALLRKKQKNELKLRFAAGMNG